MHKHIPAYHHAQKWIQQLFQLSGFVSITGAQLSTEPPLHVEVVPMGCLARRLDGQLSQGTRAPQTYKPETKCRRICFATASVDLFG